MAVPQRAVDVLSSVKSMNLGDGEVQKYFSSGSSQTLAAAQHARRIRSRDNLIDPRPRDHLLSSVRFGVG